MHVAEDNSDVGEVECNDSVPDTSVSVNEQTDEMGENKASSSTEEPDNTDITMPDSARNTDVTLSVSAETDSKQQSVIDTEHLHTDNVTPNPPSSPVNSPVHVVRTLITQDDPLGLFTSTVTPASCRTTAADPRTSQSSDNVVESARMTLLTRRISEDAIGRTSWVAGATDSSLRKCSSLNRLSSESAQRKTSAPVNSMAVSRVSMASDSNRPSSASPRTSLFGGTFRSAATRFASKYREIRESMGPPQSSTQPVKLSLPLPSGTSQEQGISSAGDKTPTDTTNVTSSETDNPPVSAATTDTAGTPVPDITVTTQSGKSRLRVPPSLYSPLGKSFVISESVLVCLHVL